jgi:DNA mismatch endonuclease (patch repair protein)
MPSNRAEFWQAKFTANVKRDDTQHKKLRTLGWRVVTIWECETRKPDLLRGKLARAFRAKPER